ncbi:MAG: hypothetical protein GF334_08825 [Candidatus Altiarchaeales archaeon]|nr:hypothetical protein [Candidatus Altiarchaeales archaeon]
MPKYRRKYPVIEGIKWKKDQSNTQEVLGFCNRSPSHCEARLKDPAVGGSGGGLSLSYLVQESILYLISSDGSSQPCLPGDMIIRRTDGALDRLPAVLCDLYEEIKE